MARYTIVPENGILRARAPYDDTYSVVVDVAGPSLVTLPSSGTYDSDELIVELNGQALRPTEDYTFAGSPPRTQVSIIQDLKAGDKVRFRKVHNL